MLTFNYPNPNPWQLLNSSSGYSSNPKTPISLPLFRPKTQQLPKITNNTNHETENNTTKQNSAGKIKRLVLNQEGRTKLNINSDREFYAYPRFVTHVDDAFISSLSNLYREKLNPGSEILDLMSSWVSHLPKEVVYKKVVGHGLNAQELAKNPRLDYFFVKDLNQDQKLEMESCSFDAVLCTVSVQYLQQPEKVSSCCFFSLTKTVEIGICHALAEFEWMVLIYIMKELSYAKNDILSSLN